MTETTLDRVPIAQAQAESGISRSSFYGRLKAAGIVPLKVGNSSFLTREHLETLADLDRFVQAGNKPEDFLPADGQKGNGSLVATRANLAALAQHLPLLQQEPEEQAPEDLVGAEVEHLDRLLSFLTKAARLGWALPTSKVELLLGTRPRGGTIERYGFTFRATTQQGREIAWRVERS